MNRKIKLAYLLILDSDHLVLKDSRPGDLSEAFEFVSRMDVGDMPWFARTENIIKGTHGADILTKALFKNDM